MALSKRELLGLLTRDELLDVVDQFDLSVDDRRVRTGLVDAIASSPRAVLEDALPHLSRDRLKELCRAFDLEDGGREKTILVARLLEDCGANDSAPSASGEWRLEDDPSVGDNASETAEDVVDDYAYEPGAAIIEQQPEDRDYQVESLHELNNAFAQHRRVVLSLPTGAGKTFVAAKWLDDNLSKRALWLTHRVELVRQTAEELRRVFGRRRSVTLWTSAEKDDTGEVIIATVGCQTIPEGPFEILVVDEAHHRAAPSYKEWAQEYSFEKELGLTATPERHDGVSLGYEFTVKRSFWDLVQQRYLAAPIHHVVKTNERYDLRKDRIRDDFEEASLRALDNPKRNSIIVEQYLRCQGEYRKTLIFAINVVHAENLVAMFAEMAPHVRTASILGTTEVALRAKLVDDFEKGRIDVLINCKVFVEGFNCKDIESIFLTRPTMSAVLYCQMVGRGTRVVGTKKTFHLIEFEDQLSMFADKLAGFWDLGGTSDAEVIRKARERAKVRPADPPLLLSSSQISQWSTDLHVLGGVLAYWEPPAFLQGATLVYKGEIDLVAAAVNAGAGIDRDGLKKAIRAGHWLPDEQNRLVKYVDSELRFHVYDFRHLGEGPPTGVPAAVAAIHAAAKEVAPLSKIEAFLGPSEKVDWGGDAADWRREFLSHQRSVSALLRIVDDLTGTVTPQKVFDIESTEVRTALAEVQITRGLSGERWYAVQEAIYLKHLKGTSLTKYTWDCLARSVFRGDTTILDLRAA